MASDHNICQKNNLWLNKHWQSDAKISKNIQMKIDSYVWNRKLGVTYLSCQLLAEFHGLFGQDVCLFAMFNPFSHQN